NGTSTFIMPGQASVVQPGGFLVLPTNSGRRTSDEFTVVPEVSVGLGYQITQRLRGTIGYTFIYWPNVYRAGDQIDTRVNISQLPFATGPGTLVGAPRPAPRLKE